VGIVKCFGYSCDLLSSIFIPCKVTVAVHISPCRIACLRVSKENVDSNACETLWSSSVEPQGRDE
jgi:hypothetical protein